jgi:hypothetical protein
MPTFLILDAAGDVLGTQQSPTVPTDTARRRYVRVADAEFARIRADSTKTYRYDRQTDRVIIEENPRWQESGDEPRLPAGEH